ncbi:Tankyrase-2 [Dactylella cylindrospora]|nr:Tankyrase-2 [Dactylella cylindrospora]
MHNTMDREKGATHINVAVVKVESDVILPPPDSPCWRQGKEIFLKTLFTGPNSPKRETVESFLKENWNLSKTISNCESLQHKADAAYQKTKGGRFVADLLTSLVMVKKVADPFLQYAPETISIAWCAISGLITIASNDVENCGIISETCNHIVLIILACRIYENRYTRDFERRGAGPGDEEIELKIIQAIPGLVALVFDFSWYIRHHLGESRIKRSFRETFSPKLKDKVQAIADEYRRIRDIANDAFQERVMDSVEDIRQSIQRNREDMKSTLFPALHDISEKLNEIHAIKGSLSLMQLRNEFLYKRERWFSPNEAHSRLFRSIFDPVSRHAEILCQWLFTDDHYKSWEQITVPPEPDNNSGPLAGTTEISDTPQRKIFYIRGKPGFGKSVAMSCVLNRLTKATNNPFCYFFFRQGDEATQMTLRALDSLAAQLFNEAWAKTESEMSQLNELLSHLGDTPKSAESDRPGKDDTTDKPVEIVLSAEAMIKLIGSMVDILNKPVFILIDAVDECIDHETHQLIPLLHKLVKSSDKIKLIFSSRDNISLETLFGVDAPASDADDDRSWNFSDCITNKDSVIMTITEEKTSQDMELFLRKSLKNIMSRRMLGYRALDQKADRKALAFSEDTNQIVTSIKQKANGMFTYAAMVIASLEQPSPMSLSQKLRKLPDGMDALYRRRLESMGVEERKLMVLALKWVVWGWGNISAVQIAEQFKNIYGSAEPLDDEEGTVDYSAIDDDEESKAPIKEAIKDPEIAETIYHLRVIGRDFFKINGDNYIIDVIHKSVRDWVENEAAKADDKESQLKSVTPTFVLDETGNLKVSLELPANIAKNQNNSVNLPSKRESRLDIATYMLHVLSNPRFQKRHMPYKPPDSSLTRKSTSSLEGLQDNTAEDSQEQALPATEGGSGTPSDSQSQARPGGLTHQPTSSFTVSTVKEKKEYRYEIYNLVQHLKDVEKLWPKADRRGEKWDLFWKKLKEFAKMEHYKHWQVQYSQFYMDVSEKNAYKPKLYQGLIHIAGVRSMNMVVEYLLENKLAGPDDEDGTGWTAFSIAVLKPDMWELFLKYGADPSKRDPMSEQTPFQRALRILGLEYETMSDNYKDDLVKCCLLLIPREKDINQPIDWALGKKRPLHVATLTKSWDLFDALMKHPDINVSATDQSGDSALHTALIWTPPGTETTLKKMITALIDAGLDPNQENRDSATALPNAITNQLKDVVELLLEKGADPKDESFTGYTALHWAAARELNVAQAIDNNVAISIFKLILSYDPDFERETSEGTTPLDLAFKCRNWDFVKAVLDEYEKKYGKERPYLMRRDKHNRNFLHHCAQNFRWGAEICNQLLPTMKEEQIKELLKDVSTFEDMSKRGLPGYLAKAKDCAGTPLLDAIQEGHIDLVKIYLQNGAEIATRSTNGSTCFDEAVLGLYRAKMEATPFGDEVGLESKIEKARRFEKCCREVIEASSELVQASNPANLHYLVGKGAILLIGQVLDCGVDYKYKDEFGWTVVEWAHAFKEDHTLNYLTDLVRIKYGSFDLDLELRKGPTPKKMIGKRRGRSHMNIMDDGLTFETVPDLDHIQLDRHATAVAIFECPVSPATQISYFEVTFLECTTLKIDGCVGFVGEFFRLNRIPGATAQGGDDSVSLFGDDGALYATFENIDTWRLSGSTSAGEMIFGPGDTVGCGLDVKQGLIFYTLNGEYAGVGFESIHGRWYGAVGCEVRCKGKVNLGAEPFMFEEMNDMIASGQI